VGLHVCAVRTASLGGLLCATILAAVRRPSEVYGKVPGPQNSKRFASSLCPASRCSCSNLIDAIVYIHPGSHTPGFTKAGLLKLPQFILMLKLIV
jgi:hypothetical protein